MYATHGLIAIHRDCRDNTVVRIEIHDTDRESLGSIDIDLDSPPRVVKLPGSEREIHLQWDGARDDQGYLRCCPSCGCRELFARKDFPQVTGFGIVVLAAAVAMYLFGQNLYWLAFSVLGAVALIDAVIFLFAGRCLVCYRCRSEFRRLPIRGDHAGWDLSIGEKYRPVRLPSGEDEN